MWHVGQAAGAAAGQGAGHLRLGGCSCPGCPAERGGRGGLGRAALQGAAAARMRPLQLDGVSGPAAPAQHSTGLYISLLSSSIGARGFLCKQQGGKGNHSSSTQKWGRRRGKNEHAGLIPRVRFGTEEGAASLRSHHTWYIAHSALSGGATGWRRSGLCLRLEQVLLPKLLHRCVAVPQLARLAAGVVPHTGEYELLRAWQLRDAEWRHAVAVHVAPPAARLRGRQGAATGRPSEAGKAATGALADASRHQLGHMGEYIRAWLTM